MVSATLRLRQIVEAGAERGGNRAHGLDRRAVDGALDARDVRLGNAGLRGEPGLGEAAKLAPHPDRVLAGDDALSAVARGHSMDMAQRGYFEHATPEGLTPSDRAAEAGYGCRKDYDTFYTEGVAENIYSGWLYGSTTFFGPVGVKDYLTPHEIAQGAADGWMDSPGHREIMLDPQYVRVGTGVTVSEEKSVLITQNFC